MSLGKTDLFSSDKERLMLFYIHIYIHFNYIKISASLHSTKFSSGLHRQAVALT